MDFDEEYLYGVCRLSREQRQSLCHYYFRLSEPERVMAHHIQTDLMRQHIKRKHKEKADEYTYAMLLIALSKMIALEKAKKTKRNLSEKEQHILEQRQVARIKSFKQGKDGKQLHRITVFFEEIKKLREQHNMSWREVALFIEKNRRVKISHSYLQQTYNKIQQSRHIDEQ